MSERQENNKKLPKYVERLVTSGPVDYYVCDLCKGNINPFFFDYHLKEKHPEVVAENGKVRDAAPA